LAHDFAAVSGVELRLRDCGANVGPEVGDGEGSWMIEVSIQGQGESRTFQDDPNASVATAMNTPLVALGTAKEAFEVEVVAREVRDVFAHEEPGSEGLHGLGHGLAPRMDRAAESLLELLE